MGTPKEVATSTSKQVNSLTAKAIRINSTSKENPWNKPKTKVKQLSKKHTPEAYEQLNIWRYKATSNFEAHETMKSNFNAVLSTLSCAKFEIQDTLATLKLFEKERDDATIEKDEILKEIQQAKQMDRITRIEYCRAIDQAKSERDESLKREQKVKAELEALKQA